MEDETSSAPLRVSRAFDGFEAEVTAFLGSGVLPARNARHAAEKPVFRKRTRSTTASPRSPVERYKKPRPAAAATAETGAGRWREEEAGAAVAALPRGDTPSLNREGPAPQSPQDISDGDEYESLPPASPGPVPTFACVLEVGTRRWPAENVAADASFVKAGRAADRQRILTHGGPTTTSQNVEVSPWTAPFPWDETVELANREIFGNTHFRPMQRQAINAIMAGRDVFLIMPTGGGKSLCFQLCAVVTPAVTVVVMPLLSLMNDQFRQMTRLGISCRAFLGEEKSFRAVYADLENRQLDVKLLFISPERLANSPGLVACLERLHAQRRLARFVIDEAHCVSQWGNDFRRDYLNLRRLRESFPAVPIVCMTATATRAIQNDITQLLAIPDAAVFKLPFDRPNIGFSVLPKARLNLAHQVVELITEQFGRDACGIVYCLSKRDCEQIAAALAADGISSGVYHSTAPDKDRVQEAWMAGQVTVVVATVAFGMGIDKRQVRFVIHSSMAKSVENYYQEAGRAGRDGAACDSVVLYDFHDTLRLQQLSDGGGAAGARASRVRGGSSSDDRIREMALYCESLTECRRSMLMQHFGEGTAGDGGAVRCNENTVLCDICAGAKTASTVKFGGDLDRSVRAILGAVRAVEAAVGPTSRVLTLASLAACMQGTRRVAPELASAPGYGALKSVGKAPLLKLLHTLCLHKVLLIRCVRLNQGFVGVLGSNPQYAGPLPPVQVLYYEEAATRRRPGGSAGGGLVRRGGPTTSAAFAAVVGRRAPRRAAPAAAAARGAIPSDDDADGPGGAGDMADFDDENAYVQ